MAIIFMFLLSFSLNFAMEKNNTKGILAFFSKFKKPKKHFLLQDTKDDIEVDQESIPAFILRTISANQGCCSVKVLHDTEHDGRGRHYKAYFDCESLKYLNKFATMRLSGKYITVLIGDKYGDSEKEKCIFKKNFNFLKYLFSCSPDFSKIILLSYKNNYDLHFGAPTVYIIDTSTGNIKFKIKVNGKFKLTPVKDSSGSLIAISNDGQYFAIASGFTINSKYIYILALYDKFLGLIKNCQTKEFDEKIISFAFNAQGTKLITHSRFDYEIFDLNDNIEKA